MRKTGLYLILLIFLIACSNDDTTSTDCGCENENFRLVPSEEFNIPFEDQSTGWLFYKHPEIIDEYAERDYLNYKFWIVAKNNSSCSNCKQTYIVCNEKLLQPELSYLKKEGETDSLKVSFFGKVKVLSCARYDDNPILRPGDYAYSRIVLDSIRLK